MKRKIIYLILTMLIASLVFVTGCGDTFKLAGSASVVNDESQEYEEELQEQIEENDFDEQLEERDVIDTETVTVVLNTNKTRKRIHMYGASCTKNIKAENYQEWTGTADELKAYAEENGFVACGTCHPDTKLNIDLPKKK